MNQLKFRCWNKETKQMLYDGFVIRCGCDNKGAEILETPNAAQNSVISEIMNDQWASYSLIDWSNFYSLENLITMQATGTQDIDGKDLYDGDIVETWKFTTGETSKRVIVWNKVRCGFRLYTIDHYNRNIHNSPQSMVNVTTIKLLGNITTVVLNQLDFLN